MSSYDIIEMEGDYVSRIVGYMSNNKSRKPICLCFVILNNCVEELLKLISSMHGDESLLFCMGVKLGRSN